MAHVAAALIGVGQVRINGSLLPAKTGLRRAGLKPLLLRGKEGLALLNGTQVSTALALHALFRVEDVFAAALVTGALSVDAVKASDVPFDRASMRSDGRKASSRWRPHFDDCSPAATCGHHTCIANASRIPTRCAVSHRSWVRASI